MTTHDCDPKSPSVLFFSHHSTVIGGGEISLLTMVEGLVGLGWSVTLAVPEIDVVARRAAALGAHTCATPMPSLRRPGGALLRAVRSARRLACDLSPDIIHANGSRAMFFAGWAGRAARRPAIWHLRILEHERAFDAVLVRLASAFIAISAAVRGRLEPWPEAYRACRVIPNGLNLEAFVPRRARADVRAELGLADGDEVVIDVGRLVDFKRHELLLEALSIVRRTRPAARAVIVGEGPDAAGLRAHAERDESTRDTVFTGGRDDVADLLGAADVFVLTSPVEGFGRVLIEAMAVGLPCVAVAAGGPAEIIKDDESGLLVEPNAPEMLANAIEHLLADATLRTRLGEAGRRRVETEYSMTVHAERVAAFYRNVQRGRAR